MKASKQEVEAAIRTARKAIDENNAADALQLAKRAVKSSSTCGSDWLYAYAQLHLAAAFTLQRKTKEATELNNEVFSIIEKNGTIADVVWMYRCYASNFSNNYEFDTSFLYAQKAFELAKEHSIITELYRCALNYAGKHATLYNFSGCLDILDGIIDELQQQEPSITRARIYALYAHSLKCLQRYDQAVEYYNKAQIDGEKVNDWFSSSQALTSIYQIELTLHKTHNLDVLQLAIEHSRKHFLVLPLLNSLHYYALYLQEVGELKKAKNTIDEIRDIAEKGNDNWGRWMALYLESRWYLNKKNFTKARSGLDELSRLTAIHVRIEYKYREIELRYDIEKAAGNMELAMQYMEERAEVERQMLVLQAEDREKAVMVLERVQQTKAALSEEVKRVQQKEEELNKRNAQIVAVSLELEEKKKTILKIKKLAERSIGKNDTSTSNNETLPELADIINSAGTNENSWLQLTQHLERLHPEFTTRLLQQSPTLTPSEVRVCCLLRLQLVTKEIASILNVSERTIDVQRASIRKKSNIPSSVNLVTWVMNL
ncbi:MAG: helix-turn-helix transcriptional regulator [Candidatus Kapaibacterium sp.]|nr:helix-turn-helix transcriptional regulator [Bacteroidota bacterium]